MELQRTSQGLSKPGKAIYYTSNHGSQKPDQANATPPNPQEGVPGVKAPAGGIPAANAMAAGAAVAKPIAADGRPGEAPYLKPEILAIKTSEALKDLDSSKTNKPDYRHPRIKANYLIKIQISHPKEFLELRPQDHSKLVLYANGIALPGMTTDYYSTLGSDYVKAKGKLLGDTQWITFIFARDSTTKNAWTALYKISDWKVNNTNFDLSLGWEGMFPLDYSATIQTGHKITLTYYTNWIFYSLCALYFIFLVYFIDRCRYTGLIRDPDKTGSGQYGPYSLAQTQLAFWTVIISGGFIYLILLTGLTDSMNDSCLILLGITGGTTGIAGFIDYAKKRQQESAANTAVAANLALVKPFVKLHKNFLLDITSDGVNVSVQRTQTVLWNCILGAYFIWYVVSNKSMPVFSNVLLLLAGASSAMYLTSKVPENPQPPASTPPHSGSCSQKDPDRSGTSDGNPIGETAPPQPAHPADEKDTPLTPLPPEAK